MTSPHGPQDRGPKGRGAISQPPNRFGGLQREMDLEQISLDEESLAEVQAAPTIYLPDASRSIISENDSPDLGFRYSLNPYRGCQHGCAYCYARPTHEYLGLSAGLDFESRIFVKHEAPRLLREWLARKGYVPETIIMSGVTDCYQPGERQFRVTRGCLETALAARQPIGIITKNALVLRDLDLLAEMAAHQTVSVAISITTLDANLARSLEPRTSSPDARLRALAALNAAGIPTRVMVAPVIPGLNDSEIAAILAAARDAGTRSAGYTLLRLPYAVKSIFQEWLSRERPSLAGRVEGLIRATREGQLSDSRWGSRFRGKGAIAEQIRQSFEVFSRKYGIDHEGPALETSRFQAPLPGSGQMRLF